MKACGHDNVYCPGGERVAAPLRVHTGYYTADYSSMYPNTMQEVEVVANDDEDSEERMSFNKYISIQLNYQVSN
jgi:hypothetical protein